MNFLLTAYIEESHVDIYNITSEIMHQSHTQLESKCPLQATG